MEDSESVVQTVEIIKRPGQSLGFYIREGNGKERWDGVFISRLAVGSVAEQNGLLKIGDEILSINGNPVIRKRLEDVVISMSIPKRLVLVVRRNPNAASIAGDATSLGSSLSGGQSGGDEEQLPPVVVVKCPRPQSQSSYNPHTLGSSMVMQASTHSSRSPGSDHYQQPGDFYIGEQQRFAYSSSPAGVQRRGGADDYWGSLGRMGGPLMIQTQQQGFLGGDDSGDSGLSSDNSGFFRQVESTSQSSSTAAKSDLKQEGVNLPPQAPSSNELAFREDYEISANNPMLQNQQFQQQQSRPTSFSNSLSSCRAPSIERCTTSFTRNPVSYQRRSCSARPDYSSDSDTYTFEHIPNRQNLNQLRTAATTTVSTAADFYPSHMQMSGMTLDWPSDYNPQWRFSPGEYATLDRRFSYSNMTAEHQMSIKQRWDVMHSWNQRAKERREAGRYPGQGGEVVDGEAPAYQQDGQACSSSLNSLLRQFDTFAIDQNRSPYLSDDLTSLYSGGAGVSSDKETYTLGRQMSLNYPYTVVSGNGQGNEGKSPSSAQMDLSRMMTPTGSASRRRIVKKMTSNEEFHESGKDEQADPSSSSSSSYRSLQINAASSTRNVVNSQQSQQGQPQQGTMSGSSSSLSSNSHQSRTLTRNPSVTGGSGDIPSKNLIKVPLHIRKEAFKPYQSILPHQSFSKTDNGEESLPPLPLEGTLVCHVFCGHGLVSNRAVLQDLYCVVELDSLGCARTTVHTGAMNFDWDDKFEMDLYSARYLSFSVYSYDPGQGTRHRLVYGGSVHLSFLLQKHPQHSQHHHRLALQLQPRGILYIELFYYTVEDVFKRTPSLHLNSLFGTELMTVVDRENSGKAVPMIVVRCVEEIEKRGMGQVGLYRLCGSARRKLQLREELEKDPLHIDLSPSVVGDINVVTVILKDFLKELPEPLFPSSAYRDLQELYARQGVTNARQVLVSLLDRCHQYNRNTFLFLLDHLQNVSNLCHANKMNLLNLSIIFGPLIFHASTSSAGENTSSENFGNSSSSLSQHAEMLKFVLEVMAGNGDKNN